MPAEYARYPSLRDRAVFVTGGATGIGAELVSQFAAQGAKVAFVDIDGDAGAALAKQVAVQGSPAPRFEVCDIRDIDALQGCIADAAQEIGPIRVLVNNAANDDRHAVDEVTPEYWDDKMAVNLRPHFFTMQAVAPMMRAAGGGSIVNFGSITWRGGFGGLPAYATAKAAIEGLTRAMARDLGPDGIRVNAVVPGWIMTERQVRTWITPEAEERIARSQCLKDKLVPADVARLVLWLAADDSRMCTNQMWVIDGGWI
ncbi:SDR family oxidoreductase [Actinopolymorpha sp. B17G11]|uniref:SDR family NAD(P)-dependent oxidoreductase n=1 Tax=Actinopolymorpha sp. B17G11 TaxID=3160861 RepID=UPI0032E4A886